MLLQKLVASTLPKRGPQGFEARGVDGSCGTPEGVALAKQVD
jgi:hypothetical protein